MEGNTDLKPPPDLLNSKSYSHRLIMQYNVLITILLITSLNMHVILRKNINDRFPELTSALNIRKCSKSITINIVYLCKASYGNPASSQYNINLNSFANLDNNYTLYKTPQKFTDSDFKNSAENVTTKIFSAFPYYITNTDSTDTKLTYLGRKKFSPPVNCVNPTKNPNTSVKSRQIQCENTSKSFHVHHLGFVLVTSVCKRTTPRSPKQLLFNTRPYGILIVVVLSKEPGSAILPHYDNKCIYKVARLENKFQVTCKYWTKMQIFTKISWKNTSLTIWTSCTVYGEPSLTGIYRKKHYKQPKYQPLKYTCMVEKIIMIIDHITRCIHVHDPPYKLWLL